MANWAVVIGIDQYWVPQACLRGAARDALAMREWLLDRSGGDVHPDHLVLLLSPTEQGKAWVQGAQPPAGVSFEPATRVNIVTALDRLMTDSGGAGDRLFFHYAGHGLLDPSPFSLESAIATTDFTKVVTDNSVSLSSIFRYFKATQFREQFFFIDACRNIPWQAEGRPFRVGELPRPNVPNFNVAQSAQQFIFYATSRGLKAQEEHEAANERGAFTQALLDGLRGKGRAKSWDGDTDRYVVTVDRLFEFVEGELQGQKRQVGGTLGEQLFQLPRRDGERGAANPTLRRFGGNEFAAETMRVFVEPSGIVSQVEITVRDEYGDLVEHRTQLAGLPAEFRLLPRPYVVRAAAPNHAPARLKGWKVDFYPPSDPMTLELSPTGEATSPLDTAPTRGGGGTRGGLDEPEPGSLEVLSGDALAALEVVDGHGNILASGLGQVQHPSIKPGLYRARLRLPDGQMVEEAVEVLPGEAESVTLVAPALQSVVVQELCQKIGFVPLPDNTLQLSETSGVGPVAAPSLSTVLALAGGVSTHDEATLGAWNVRSLGLPKFADRVPGNPPSGFQALVGIETENPVAANAMLAGVRVCLWPHGAPMPDATEVLLPRPFSSLPGLGELAVAATPGPHWLAIELDTPPPPALVAYSESSALPPAPTGEEIVPTVRVVLNVALLPGRMTLLVFHQEPSGQGFLYQYMPELHGMSGAQSYDHSDDTTPGFIRRLDMVQRYALNGQSKHAHETALGFLHAKWVDPLAGCLGGFLMARLGKADELGAAAYNLSNVFGALSDSHVLRGMYEASRGQEAAARAAFGDALNVGLPLFADGVARLRDAVEVYGMDHPRVPLLNRVAARQVTGMLWTAWVPEALVPGQPLEV